MCVPGKKYYYNYAAAAAYLVLLKTDRRERGGRNRMSHFGTQVKGYRSLLYNSHGHPKKPIRHNPLIFGYTTRFITAPCISSHDEP